MKSASFNALTFARVYEIKVQDDDGIVTAIIPIEFFENEKDYDKITDFLKALEIKELTIYNSNAFKYKDYHFSNDITVNYK